MGSPDVVIAPPHDSPSRAATVTVEGYGRQFAAAIGTRRAELDAALARLARAAPALAGVAALVIGALRGGQRVLVAGNGGSAAEAQHFAAELVGRFRREREPYAVVALTADAAILTAVANDYGYAEVFARQVRGLGQRGDLLLLFSTSGESENLVRAAQVARQRGLTTIAIIGARPCRLAGLAEFVVRAPATEAPLVQELHQVITHLLCAVIEAELARTPLVGVPRDDERQAPEVER